MRYVRCLHRLLLFALLLGASISVAQSSSAPLSPALVNSSAADDVEDFSTASLATSNLQPEPPELVEKTEEPDFIREFVAVEWRPGDPIYLYVIRPSKFQKPPVVIYLYDYPAETDIYRDDDWCARTTSGGYAVVGFVPALSGHRYHDRPMKEWFVSELQEALAKSSHDVQMVLTYLAQRGDVDMNRVGMFGVGAGATIATAAASVDSRIKAIDLVNPWGDWPVWVAKSEVVPEDERAVYTKPEFLKRVAAFDPVALLPQLKIPRIRLSQTNDNQSVPEDARKHMAAALPHQAEYQRYARGAQRYSASAPEGGVLEWLKVQLRPAPSNKISSQ